MKILNILDILWVLMVSPATILAERLCTWLSGWLAKQKLPTQFRVSPLAGDGSPRPFYRIEIPGKSFVLLSEPAWTLSKDYPAHQAYLASHQIPVPHFLAVDTQLGALLMEDLGDELLQARILAEPQHRLDWLGKATELLAHLHGAAFPVPRDLPVFSRQFDERKYSEEFQFTFHHLVEGFLKLPALSPRVLASVQSFCADLETFRPLVFCHRDYHTRNLLVHEGQLRLIDFQDARLGPVEYDLASLFFDAYVPIASDDRNRLLSLYRKRLENFPLGAQIDWKQLPDRLHHLAFQRTIKAAGSFASFFTRYGKNTHLPYLVPALESARSLQKILGAAAPALPLDRWIEKARGVVR